MTALGYGLSFSISNMDVNYLDISKGFSNLEKYSEILDDNINICKGMVYGSLLKGTVPNCPERFIQAFKTLKDDNALHITKADMSNAFCEIFLFTLP